MYTKKMTNANDLLYNYTMYTCQECNKKINTIYRKDFKKNNKVDYYKWVCNSCNEKEKDKKRR